MLQHELCLDSFVLTVPRRGFLDYCWCAYQIGNIIMIITVVVANKFLCLVGPPWGERHYCEP